MMPFRRQPIPASFWQEKQQALWERLKQGADCPDVLSWQHQGQYLRDWFHQKVRPESAPRLCAYCDGALGETSAATVDHFFPRAVFPYLALHWENLFPACELCNEHNKGQQWSCNLLRPDADLYREQLSDFAAFARLFELDPETGKLQPNLLASRRDRARVRLTLRVFQLNRPGLCQARKERLRDLRNAVKAGDQPRLDENVALGPFRYVAAQFLAAQPTLAPSGG
jgi:uncharacterized protein (TIGR02646 family)